MFYRLTKRDSIIVKNQDINRCLRNTLQLINVEQSVRCDVFEITILASSSLSFINVIFFDAECS